MPSFKKLKDTYPLKNCPIATVELEKFTSNNIINMIGYENTITYNSEVYSTVEELTNISGSFPITHYLNNKYKLNYLITEKVNAKNVPVFFTYELKYDCSAITKSDTVQIYKNNEELVPQSEYVIEFGDVTLYNNFTGSNDPNKNRYGSDIIWSSEFNSNNTYHRVRVLLPLSFHNPDDFYIIRYVKNLFNINYETHFELIELQQLYKIDTNYKITSDNKINQLVGIGDSNILYCVKHPDSQIKVKSVYNLITHEDSEENTSWCLKINNGEFIRSIDNFGTTTEFYNCEFPNRENLKYQPLSYVKPKIIDDNIIKLEEVPIYISGYVYPNYNINIFPNTTYSNASIKGSIGINLDNNLVEDLSITSIDRNKGYILFNKNFDKTLDMSFFIYVDMTKNIYIRNLELNPRLKTKYGFNSQSNFKFKEIGIAIRKTPANMNPLSDTTDYTYPYFFDYTQPNNDGTFTFYKSQLTPSANYTTETIDDMLVWNPYNSDVNTSGNFIPIASIKLNKLNPDVLTITDARVINGGFDKSKQYLLSNNELNSFTDIGYVDGELLPHQGLKIIHIPRKIYNDLVSRWKNSGLFNSNQYIDITEYELDKLKDENPENQQYYDAILQGNTTLNEQYKSPYVKMLNDWAEYEASYYLDRMIKKYISAGMQYILMDENFKLINLKLDI